MSGQLTVNYPRCEEGEGTGDGVMGVSEIEEEEEGMANMGAELEWSSWQNRKFMPSQANSRQLTS